MRIDCYITLDPRHRGFGIRASGQTFNRTVVLEEFTDAQIVRLALDNLIFWVKSNGIVAPRVLVHLDEDYTRGGVGAGVRHTLDIDGDESLQESIARLKGVLLKAKDLEFLYSPRGGDML